MLPPERPRTPHPGPEYRRSHSILTGTGSCTARRSFEHATRSETNPTKWSTFNRVVCTCNSISRAWGYNVANLQPILAFLQLGMPIILTLLHWSRFWRNWRWTLRIEGFGPEQGPFRFDFESTGPHMVHVNSGASGGPWRESPRFTGKDSSAV